MLCFLVFGGQFIFAKSIIVILIFYGSFYYAMGFYFKCFGWLESYIDLMGLKYYGEIIEYVRNIKET